MKTAICTTLGVVGSIVTTMFGGWDQGLITLLIFMGIDYLSGIVLAAVFHKSNKTDTGSLKSTVGLKGICKKCMILLFVLIAYRLDLTIGANYIRDTVIIAFITNELISITENAGLMGIPMPAVLKKAIDVLQDKGEE